MTLTRTLPDWLDGYLEYTTNTEPPYMYHMWMGISTIASLLQRKCCLEWGTLKFYPNMYIVLVGPPGRTRKGTAMNLAKPFLHELDIKIAAEATTREALIRALAEASDTTPDMASGKLYTHSSLTVFSPELTVFLGYNNSQLLSDLTDWFDCSERWKYRTKHQGIDDIIGVYLTLIGGTTPDLIRTTLPLDAIGGGLTSRMIFIYEHDKGKIVPYPGLTDEQLVIYDKLRKDAARIHLLRGNFKVTKDFLNRWFDWYTNESNPTFNDSRFAGYFERKPMHIMKLSMIMCASRTDDMKITEGDLNRAIKLMNDTERKMPRTFSGVGSHQNAAVLTQVMNEIGLSKKMRRSQILQLFHRDLDGWMLDNMIKTLEGMKFITVTYGMQDDPLVTYIQGADPMVED